MGPAVVLNFSALYRSARGDREGVKEGPLEGTLNLIPLFNPYIYIYIPHIIVPKYLSSP